MTVVKDAAVLRSIEDAMEEARFEGRTLVTFELDSKTRTCDMRESLMKFAFGQTRSVRAASDVMAGTGLEAELRAVGEHVAEATGAAAARLELAAAPTPRDGEVAVRLPLSARELFTPVGISNAPLTLPSPPRGGEGIELPLPHRGRGKG